MAARNAACDLAAHQPRMARRLPLQYPGVNVFTLPALVEAP
jgi:hypothetical protein